MPSVFAAGAKLEQLASGFSNASGLTTAPNGTLFFTDAAMHRVYRWNSATRQAEILTDKLQSPMAVGFISPNSLLAIDYSRTVYSVDPLTGATSKIAPAHTPSDGTSLLLPVGLHNSLETLRRQMERRGIVYAPRSNMAIVANVVDEPRDFFYAPDTTTAVMAGGNWQPMLQASQCGSRSSGHGTLRRQRGGRRRLPRYATPRSALSKSRSLLHAAAPAS